MARELPERFGIAPHAARRSATRTMVLGAALAVLGAAAAVQVSSVGVMIAMTGASLAALGAHNRRTGPAAQVINRASNLLTAGRIAEATELLDHAAESFKDPTMQRAVDLHRVMLAMRGGALDQALEHAEAALARPVSWISRDQDRMHLAVARSLRGLIRASTGEADGARADVAEVRADPLSTPGALASAELATAILLERSGDRAALREHLARERRLLFEYTQPRERALVRAYQRMLEARVTSVYREAAPAEAPPGEEPALAGWVARLAPGAASFVRASAAARPGGAAGNAGAAGDAAAADPAPMQPAQPAARAAAEVRAEAPRGGRKGWHVLLLWVVLIMMFLAIWQLAAVDPAPAGAAAVPRPAATREAPAAIGYAASFAAGALLIGLFAVLVARAQRQSRKLMGALVALARGDDARAARELEGLARGKAASVSAQAHLSLAHMAERRADFAAALQHCEAALGALNTEELRAYASDILMPSILAERAVLFATMDRAADATAEMEVVAERYPSYPILTAARLRVALTLAARRGDVAALARMAEEMGDLPIGPGEELLADLGRAAARPGSAGAGEVERLKAELRTYPDMQRWVEAVAPAVLAAFSQAEQARERALAEEIEGEMEAAAAEEAAAAARA